MVTQISGQGSQIDPQQIYWYLRMKHGVSDAAAKGILANIWYESTFNPRAIGDGGTSIGLFQHHKTRADNLKAFAAQTGRNWNDWTAQVDFAIREANSRGANLQSNNAVEFSKWWTIYWEIPADRHRKANERARIVNQFTYDPQGYVNYGYQVQGGRVIAGPGIGNTPVTTTFVHSFRSPTQISQLPTATQVGQANPGWNSGGNQAESWPSAGGGTGGTGGQGGWGGGTTVLFTGGDDTGGVGGPPSSPVVPPAGYEVWVIDGVKHAVYTITGTGGASAMVAYAAPDGITGQVRKTLTDAEARELGVATGGTVETFRGMPSGMSYQDLFERTMHEAGLFGTDALSDQGIMAILALYMARGMSDQELVSRIQQTDYWKKHTDKERSWTDKSPAQRDQETLDHAAQLISRIFTYVGEPIDFLQYDADGDGQVSVEELRKGNPELFQAAEDWASGKRTEQQLINEWLKPWAEKNENSPWSRMKRDEVLAQRQFDTDVENRAAEILGLHRKWGLNLTWDQAMGMANAVQWNEESMGKLLEDLDAQARAIYQGKPAGVDTMTWATPYLRTYQELMEQNEPDLFNNHIQEALTSGMGLGDFRRHLRNTEEWKQTDNASAEFHGVLGSMSRQMGFV